MIILRSTGPVISTRRSSEVGGHRRDAPLGAAQRLGSGEKLRQRAVIEQRLAAGARGEQLEAPRVEAAVQAREKLQRERRQHLLGTRNTRARNLDLGPGLIARIQLSVLLGVHAFQHTRFWREFDYRNFTLLISQGTRAGTGDR